MNVRDNFLKRGKNLRIRQSLNRVICFTAAFKFLEVAAENGQDWSFHLDPSNTFESKYHTVGSSRTSDGHRKIAPEPWVIFLLGSKPIFQIGAIQKGRPTRPSLGRRRVGISQKGAQILAALLSLAI